MKLTMYKKIKENSAGQHSCPSHLRDLEKLDKPSSNKKSYIPIILLIIFLCGFTFYAYLFHGIASSKRHGNKLDMIVEALENKFEGNNYSFEGYIGYHTLLKCHVEIQPNFFEIYWFYNRKQIDTSNKEKYELHDGDLEIQNLTENDAGSYKCLLINDGNFKKASYNLEIKHAYKWVEQGSPSLNDPAYGIFSFNNEFNFGHIDNGESLVPGIIHQNNFLTIKILKDEIQNKTDKVKILMINKNVQYDWVDESDGNVPSNALKVGQFIGENLFIGLTLDSQKLGVVYPEAEVMQVISDDGQTKDHYKVFVLKI